MAEKTPFWSSAILNVNILFFCHETFLFQDAFGFSCESVPLCNILQLKCSGGCSTLLKRVHHFGGYRNIDIIQISYPWLITSEKIIIIIPYRTKTLPIKQLWGLLLLDCDRSSVVQVDTSKRCAPLFSNSAWTVPGKMS